MANVQNNTARQYNLKCIGARGNRVTVRLAPGFNVVDERHWLAFVSKNGKNVDPYVASLRANGSIEFGAKANALEAEQDTDVDAAAKSKSVPVPQPAAPETEVAAAADPLDG